MIRVLNCLFDGRYGGPQKRVIDVGAGLLKHGINTILLLPFCDGATADIAEKKGLKVIKVPFTRSQKQKDVLKIIRWLFLLPKDIYLISQVIKANKINVVHVNGAYFLAPAFAAKLCRRTLIWHLNDTIVSARLAKVLSVFVRWMADEVVVAAKAVAQHYSVESIHYHVIYAPVDIQRVLQKTTYVNLGVAKRVGMVGNWNPNKGQDVFVETAAIVKSKVRGDVEFLMAGARLQSHADYAAKVDQLIDSKGVGSMIHCKGFINDAPSFFQSLDVLVLSSFTEACPMAVLEAMAAGVPVVATDVGGVKELLSPESKTAAGFVVPVGDSNQIAEKILMLLEDEAMCKKMGLNGIQLAIQHFSLEKCINAHIKIYQCLNGRD
jgi:glycosyltransferase involved in cell wall biosynthesis